VVHMPKWDQLHHFNLKECYKPHAKRSSMVMCWWYIDKCCCVGMFVYYRSKPAQNPLQGTWDLPLSRGPP